jgi:biotin carboxyl carrier protein
VGDRALALARRLAEKGLLKADAGEVLGMAVVNVKSEIAGNVWKIQLKPGDKVELEGEIMILESMKMEIPVLAEFSGRVTALLADPSSMIEEGQPLLEIGA